MRPLCNGCLARLEAAASLRTSGLLRGAEVCPSCARKVLEATAVAVVRQAEPVELPGSDPEEPPPPTERLEASTEATS